MNKKERKLIIKQIKSYISQGNTPEDMWPDAQSQGINQHDWQILVERAMQKPSKLPWILLSLLALIIAGASVWYFWLCKICDTSLRADTEQEELEKPQEEPPVLLEETDVEETKDSPTPDINDLLDQAQEELGGNSTEEKVLDEAIETEEVFAKPRLKPRIAPRTAAQTEVETVEVKKEEKPSFNFVPLE